MSASLPTIALVNHSFVPSQLIAAVVPALQTQVDRDWVPHWGGGARVFAYENGGGGRVPDAAWQIVLVNTSDEAGALGYHETTATGQPCGIVAVGDCIRDGLNWNVTISHELLEMLGDPEITKVQQVVENGVTYDYAYEVCDAVEDDQFAYPILGHFMSDFVLPAWFDTSATFGPYSFKDNLRVPLELASGGYIGRREVAPAPGQGANQPDDAPVQPQLTPPHQPPSAASGVTPWGRFFVCGVWRYHCTRVVGMPFPARRSADITQTGILGP
jgi:hypothetical protein